MKIAYAGTACSWRYRGVFKDTYNIIDIDENNNIKIDIKIVGGKRIPLSEVVSKYEPEDLDATRVINTQILVVLKILIQMQKNSIFIFYLNNIIIK